MTTSRMTGLPGRSPQQPRQRNWPVPAALLLVSAIPVLAGALRLVQLLGGPALIPAVHRFEGFPLPLIVHIVSATVFAVAGAFEFVPRFRRQHRNWHRRAGRVLAVAGLLVAGSALWMTLFYAPPPDSGFLLYVLRLVFGASLVACIVRGVTSIRNRDVAGHRAWMIRAYAIALAAGTQAFTGGVGEALFGTGALQGDLAKASGWVINLAVAEWVIRRYGGAGRSRPSVRAVRLTVPAEASS